MEIRTGKGKLTWRNGDVYEGDLLNGKRQEKVNLLIKIQEMFTREIGCNDLRFYWERVNLLGEMEMFLWVILIKILKAKE